MQTFHPQVSLAELNLMLAAAARQPTAADQARETEQRVRGQLVQALSAVSAVVLLYDAVLLWGV